MKVIKELKGFSNGKLELIQDTDLFVRKYNTVERNIPQMRAISDLGFRIPKIYNVTPYFFDMEYIVALDIKNFLLTQNLEPLIIYIKKLISKLKLTATNLKDYREIYKEKSQYIDNDYYLNLIPFRSNELINKLPDKLPQSMYYGDLTLENIIYDVRLNEFVLIDAVTIEYDSYVFDLAKLRQDLTCKWFLRNDNVYLDQKLKNILDSVFEEHREFFNDNILILMLLRVLKYCKINSFEEQYILKWINQLWK